MSKISKNWKSSQIQELKVWDLESETAKGTKGRWFKVDKFLVVTRSNSDHESEFQRQGEGTDEGTEVKELQARI